MTRVVSLIPSATEIVCALGLDRTLVGRSHSCDYPGWVRDLPALTSPKIDVEASSAEIDARVQKLLRDGLSVYKVDEKRLRDLAPDVIITQDQCEVCAASLADVQNAVCSRMDGDPKVVSLRPMSFDDVLDDVFRVATATDATERGMRVRSRLQVRTEEIVTRTVTAGDRPTVACVEWLEPLMYSGNWVPEMVQMAGGEDLFGVPAVHSTYLQWKDLVERDPDVIVLMPCGFDRERTRKELSLLTKREEWRTLKAVKEGRVYLTDGSQYFNRPGPRVVESLRILAEILHPESFEPTMRGIAWESEYT
jgi:iron complex transport system substrate-binding protein